MKLTNEAGDQVWSTDYVPFGATAGIVSDSVTNNFRLPGQYADLTGLYYNHHRYYDPDTGRYNKVDPYGEYIIYYIKSPVIRGEGLKRLKNPYAYVNSSPLLRIDREGLASCMSCCTKVGTCVYLNCYDSFLNLASGPVGFFWGLQKGLVGAVEGMAKGMGGWVLKCATDAAVAEHFCLIGCDDCYGCNPTAVQNNPTP